MSRRLYLCLAMLLISGTAGASQATGAPIEASTAKSTDQIRLEIRGRGVTVEIRSPRGVGSGKLFRVASAWPETMSVQLKAFREVEHFRATSGATTLICAIERPEGVVWQRVCRLNGGTVDPPTVSGEDFQIDFPSALFASNPDEIVLEWVDFWR